MENETIKFIDTDGVEKEAEVILCFQAGEQPKNYIVYTLNEMDNNGMIALYSSIINGEGENFKLENIDDEEEWKMVKEVMKKIVVDWKED